MNAFFFSITSDESVTEFLTMAGVMGGEPCWSGTHDVVQGVKNIGRWTQQQDGGIF